MTPNFAAQEKRRSAAGSADTILLMRNGKSEEENTWRPSIRQRERLGALTAPQFQRRKFAFRKSRAALAFILLFLGVYAFWKLWNIPDTKQLHTPLALVGCALVVLLVVAVGSKFVRRPKDDEKSELHL